MNPNAYKIYALSENTLTVQMSPEISEKQMQILYQIKKCIVDMALSEIYQMQVTFHELTLFYDSSSLKFESLRDRIRTCLGDHGMKITGNKPVNNNIFDIPICYDEEMALDRTRMEDRTGLTFQEITDIHHTTNYTFYMMGFLPGFLYLGGLDERLVCPRLEKPRQKVQSGSVGIAAEQTGVYPMDSPGGWNIIGRTPLKLFDYTRSVNEDEMWIKPLDKVKFNPITNQQFKELKGITPVEYKTISKK